MPFAVGRYIPGFDVGLPMIVNDLIHATNASLLLVAKMFSNGRFPRGDPEGVGVPRRAVSAGLVIESSGNGIDGFNDVYIRIRKGWSS